jgi:hypothetical protein
MTSPHLFPFSLVFVLTATGAGAATCLAGCGSSSASSPDRDAAEAGAGAGDGGADGGVDGTTRPADGAADGSAEEGACAAPTWSRLAPTTFTGPSSDNGGSQWFATVASADDAVYAMGRHAGKADLGDGAKGVSDSASMRLVKWNKDGTVAWSKAYDAPYERTVGTAAAIEPSGGIYFGGAAQNPLALGDGKSVQADSQPKAFVAKVSASGTILWATTLSNPNERAEALAVNGSQVFVLVADYSGPYRPEKPGRYHHIERLDASTGAPIGTPKGIPDSYFPLRRQRPKLAPTADGGVFVTYQVQDNLNEYPAQLVKVDAAGLVAWTRSFSENIPAKSPTFVLADIAPDGEGGVVAVTTGAMQGFENPSVSRFDATGALTWSRKLDGLASSWTASTAELGGIAVGSGDPARAVRVVGIADTTTCGERDLAIWSYALTGAPAPTRTHPFKMGVEATNESPFHGSFGPKSVTVIGTIVASRTLSATSFAMP